MTKKQENIQEEIDDLKSSLQRLQADFDNYRKKVDNERPNYLDQGKMSMIARLLPVLDTFDNALKNSHDKGLKLIHEQLIKTLRAEGLAEIECVGKPLDHELHEVLLKVDSDQDDIVLEELQKGYTLKDKILRHSKVKVGKNEDRKGNKEGEDNTAC